MVKIKELLHAKRAATEEHIKQLQREGKAGVRYTATIPDMAFLAFGLLCDAGWITHLIAGCIYFRQYGFQSVLDWLMLAALAGVVIGVAHISYLGWIREKEIATRLQKNLSFGLTVWAGLAGGIFGVARAVSCVMVPSALIFMIVGGFLGCGAGLPIFLSFQKGIIDGVR